MKKKIARILIWILSLSLIGIIIFAALLYANRESIKLAVLSEANTYLNEPVDVGSIDVSLKKFPYASLVFTDVYCRGAQAADQDTLLYSRQVFFEFDLWNVFSENLKIKHISLQDGTLHIIRPANGKPNYEIWKTDTSSTSSIFTLEQVQLNNFKTFYLEEKAQFEVKGHTQQLELKGSFAADDFQIETQGNLDIDKLKYQDSTYLRNISARPYFTLSGNSQTENTKVQISNGILKLDQHNIAFEVGITTDTTIVKANFKQSRLEELQTLIAEQKWYSSKDISLKGIASTEFSGTFITDKSPEYSLQFSTSNTTLSGINGSSLNNVKCTGTYSIKNERDQLNISTFEAEGKTGTIKGSLSIDNLDKPGVNLELQSDLALAEWLIFIPIDTITQPEGTAIVNLKFRNQFQSLQNIKPEELKRASASGSLQLKDASFTFKNANKGIRNLNANLDFAGNDLRVNSFSFETGTSDISLDGTFENVLNFIYFKDQRLRIDTRVRSKELLMEDFLADGQTSSKTSQEYSISFVKNLDLALDLKVDKFRFSEFSAEKISGQLGIKNGVVKGENISLLANEGSYAGDFTIDTRTENYYILAANLNGKKINVHQLFNSFSNFGQDVIKAENIYGTADLSVQYFSRMSPGLDIDVSTIEMTSNLKIKDGNLKNYDPLMALSDFAAIDELKDVRFATLENNISIKDSRIFIPGMNINSNVMDMGLAGSHGFNNSIDYSIRLKLSDVLFNSRKRQKKHTEFDDHLTVMESEDNPNVFLKMTGSVDNPIISLDKKGVGKSINNDLKQQGKQLKNIFKKEDKEDKKEDSGIQFDLFGDDNNDKK